MPMYRYTCNACGHEFRHLHIEGVPNDVVCPSCHSTDAERQLPRVAVQFKGSGYYKTDRARASKTGTKTSGEKSESDKPSPAPVKETTPSKTDS